MKNIQSIFTYIKGKWNLVATFTIANLLSVVFNMLSLAMLVPFMNLIFGSKELIRANPGLHFTKEGIGNFFNYQLSQIVISHENNRMWALGVLCIMVLIGIILKNIFFFISRYALHPLRNGIIRNVRANVFEKMLHLPIGFFTNERKGDVMARMTNDIKEVEDSIISVMDLIFSSPFTILFYIIVLLTLSVKLCVFLLILLPLVGFIIGRISKILKKQSTDNSQRIGNLLSIIDETLGGLRIIKAFGAEKMQQLKFTKENNYLNKLNNNIAFRREMASPLSETMGIAVLCIVLWFGGRLVLVTKEIDAGTFILFILVFTQLLDPLKKFSSIFYNIQKGSASLERINKILLATNTIVEKPNALEIKTLSKEIVLKNVGFKYENTIILENINLTIPYGKTVAIVGASGSGKSTLVDLIPRFHDCTSGEVIVDGINIKEYKLNDLRNLMGIVSQEPILFNETIANNIALAQNNVEQEKIKQAAVIANAQNFIEQKPEGFHTNIGDRGNKLSGGEKQRITIARAVLKNPPILILDEATSSLDTTSERQVQDAINNLMENRTCIVVAHRLSTVQNADSIVVLDAGKIVEQGTHAELMQLNGYYNKLVNMQKVLS
jgi:ATP-binding cassette, subfamily B, bacterial MsbA